MSSDVIVFSTSLALSLLFIAKARPSDQIGTVDIGFFVACWEPFNFGFWERAVAPAVTPYAYDLAAVLLVALSIMFARRRGIHLGVRTTISDLVTVFACLIPLTALIPLGLSLGFLKYHPRFGWAFVGTAVEYFLFVAPAEEIMFRGIVQNLLERRFGNWISLTVTAILFATIYTHISGNDIFPNWTYVAFAFVCGLAYGYSYLRSGNILVPILVHGSVDTIWRTVLS